MWLAGCPSRLPRNRTSKAGWQGAAQPRRRTRSWKTGAVRSSASGFSAAFSSDFCKLALSHGCCVESHRDRRLKSTCAAAPDRLPSRLLPHATLCRSLRASPNPEGGLKPARGFSPAPAGGGVFSHRARTIHGSCLSSVNSGSHPPSGKRYGCASAASASNACCKAVRTSSSSQLPSPVCHPL